MKHTLLWILALVALAASGQNHHLTASQAMQRIGMAGSVRSVRKAPAQSTERYYVFNREEGGYVIASADDRARAVLGYCGEGEWDPNNIPPAMRGWLESMTEALELLAQDEDEDENENETLRYEDETQSYETQSYEDETQGYEKRRAATTRVEPLLGGIQWGQNTPYNNLTPALGSTHSATGCAATAMAQIMRYHRWPTVGKGSNTYSTSTVGDAGMGTDVSDTFEGVRYDWANMLEKYILTSDGRPSNYNETQAAAVATLMRHIGVASNMDYSTGASGTTEGPMLKAMLENFNYDRSLQIYYRENFTSQEWYAMLQDEIDNERPVLMNGYSISGGHAFIIDGYDTTMGPSYFHFNWGWNGMSDGYYSVDVTDPGEQGTGGSLGGYSYNQNIFTHITKQANGVAQPHLCVSAALRYQYGQLHFQFLNRGTGTFSGQAGYAIDKGNGNVQFVSTGTYNIGFREGSGNVHASVTAPTAEGWRYYLAYKSGSNIQPMRPLIGSTPELVSISDGKGGYTLVANEALTSQMVCEDIHVEGEAFAGTTVNFGVTVRNAGQAEYNGALYLSITPLLADGEGNYIEDITNEDKATTNPLGVYIRPGEQKNYSFPYYGMLATGHYRVRVMYNPRNGGGVQYACVEGHDFEVVPYRKPVSHAPDLTLLDQELSTYEIEQGQTLLYKVHVRNTGGTDEVLTGALVTYTNDGRNWKIYDDLLGARVMAYPEGESNVTFSAVVNYAPGSYRLFLAYDDNGWKERINNNYLTFTVKEKVVEPEDGPNSAYNEAVELFKRLYTELTEITDGDCGTDWYQYDIPTSMVYGELWTVYTDYEDYAEKTAQELYDEGIMLADIQSWIERMSSLNVTKKVPQGHFVRLQGKSGKYVSLSGSASLVGTADNSSILYFSTNGEIIGYPNGQGLYQTCRLAPVGTTLNRFSVTADKIYSGYSLRSNEDSNYMLSDENGTLDTYGWVGSDKQIWQIEEVTTIPLTISAIKFATFCCPMSVILPEGVNAYTCALDQGEGSTGYVHLRKVEIVNNNDDVVLPANTPVILHAPEQQGARTYDLQLTTCRESAGSNDFYGTVVAQAMNSSFYKYYSLKQTAEGANSVGFFLKQTGTLAGFKAFLRMDKESQIASFGVAGTEGGMTTAIDQLLSDEAAGYATYDLQGRRVERVARGLYIRGGRVILK